MGEEGEERRGGRKGEKVRGQGSERGWEGEEVGKREMRAQRWEGMLERKVKSGGRGGTG